MKNIFILLIATLCFQACSENKEENWNADSLAITLSGGGVTDGEMFNAGDGNWGLNVAPDFEGTFKLDIQAEKSWKVSVDKMTGEEEDWLTTSVTEGNGKSSVDISVLANVSSEVRKASIIITTGGEIPVYKKITVVQKNLGVLNVTWKSNFLLTDDEMVVGPANRQGTVIGTYDSEGDEVVVASTRTWAKATAEAGKILLNLDAYNDADNAVSHSATITLTNVNGGASRSIELTQFASEDLSPKSTWSIEAGNDKTTYNNDNESFAKIIDGDINSHWQWKWGKADLSDFPNTPYEFIIDLGSPQLFNTISVWQTQKAQNGYVKDVQFKVSNDKAEWVDLGKYQMSASTDAAIANGAKPYTFTLPGVCKMQYIRLMILSNVGDSKVNTPKNAYLGEFSAYLK